MRIGLIYVMSLVHGKHSLDIDIDIYVNLRLIHRIKDKDQKKEKKSNFGTQSISLEFHFLGSA